MGRDIPNSRDPDPFDVAMSLTDELAIKNVIVGSASINFDSMATSVSNAKTTTVPGAKAGAIVSVGMPAAWNDSLVVDAKVSAADTLEFMCHNVSAGTIDPAAATFYYKIENIS